MQPTPSDVVHLVHLVVLSLWGGVVATEAVVEIAPFRRPELHPATIHLHYWIDLLVELPLVLAVVATGITLVVLADSLTARHVVKLAFAGGAVAVNLFCIGVVLRRARTLRVSGAQDRLWRDSRIVLACFAVGLACAAVAATVGFGLALARHPLGGP
jgi:hypothetical protein